MTDRFSATYDVETPLELDRVAEVLGGEQSTGTFVRLPGETDALRARSAARVERVLPMSEADHPALPTRAQGSRYRRGRVTLSWPVANIGPRLPTLMATVSGNLFELAEVSAIRLLDISVPESFASALPGPAHGIAGTRALSGVRYRPLIGTIVKPSVGLDARETAELAAELAHAGIDFIKDDELQADGPANPLPERARAVCAVLNRHADKAGRKVMYAFNISADIDSMARHAEHLEKLGATCAMLSLNWVGLSGLEWLRRRTPLAIHGHRNGWGLFSRSPHIGIAYPAMQLVWRLAGADHLHVNGLANKFTEPNAVVLEAARAVQAALPGTAQTPMPVFSSGQTVRQIGPTVAALNNQDFLFCAGGGIMAHPAGPAGGIRAMQQAAEAARLNVPPEIHAARHPDLAAALEKFR